MSPTLKLEKFSNSALEALARGVSEFERVSGYKTASDWPNPDFLEAIPFFLKLRAADPNSEDWNFLAVTQGKVIGEIGAKGPVSDVGEIEVGYGIAPSFRGKGFAKLALTEFVRKAFLDEHVKAILAECLVSNLASARVLERCHFERAGKRMSSEGELLLWRLER